MYETNNPSSAADSSSGATLQGEVVGTIESHRSPKQRKGISVSFSNGQIVLDRSSIVRFRHSDGYKTEPSSRPVRRE